MSRLAVLTYCAQSATGFLAEHVDSVSSQTLSPKAHLISVDHKGAGVVSEWNRLARSVGCCVEWLVFVSAETVLPSADWLDRISLNLSPTVDYLVGDGDVGVTVPPVLRFSTYEKVGGIPGGDGPLTNSMVDLRSNLAGVGAKAGPMPERPAGVL